MNFKALSQFGMVAALMVSGPSFAGTKNAAAKSSTTTQAQTPPPAPVVDGFVNVSRSTNLYDFQDGSRQDGMDYTGRMNFNISQNYLIRVDAGYSQNLKDPETSDWNDTSASLRRKPFAISRNLLMGFSVGGVAPTSKDSSKRQNSMGTMTTGLNFSVNPKALIAGLNILGSLSLSKNFHQYETDINGKVLNQYSSSQSLSVAYNWSMGLSASANFVHRNGLTYQNNIRESFEISEEIGYDITKAISVAVGHSNSGNALKANGTDSNVQFMDENSSIVYTSGTVSF